MSRVQFGLFGDLHAELFICCTHSKWPVTDEMPGFPEDSSRDSSCSLRALNATCEAELQLLCSTSSCLFFIASAPFKGDLITNFLYSLLEILEREKKCVRIHLTSLLKSSDVK